MFRHRLRDQTCFSDLGIQTLAKDHLQWVNLFLFTSEQETGERMRTVGNFNPGFCCMERFSCFSLLHGRVMSMRAVSSHCAWHMLRHAHGAAPKTTNDPSARMNQHEATGL